LEPYLYISLLVYHLGPENDPKWPKIVQESKG
jgi:hypothetical protein